MTSWIHILLKPSRRRHWRLTLAVLLGVVSWLAFKPTVALPGLGFEDKLDHFLAFASLALVACLGWSPGRFLFPSVAAAMLSYGLFVELVQSQLPTRSASMADLAADAVGIAAGLWLAHLLLGRVRDPALKKS